MKLDLGAATYTLLSAICLSGAVLVSSGPAAHAAPITFAISLSGANEVPAVSPAGTGFTTVTLDPIAQTLQAECIICRLNVANATAAHIHCCLLPGSGPNLHSCHHVACFSRLSPGNVTSGAYSSPVFDLTQATIYNPGFRHRPRRE